MAIAPPRAAAHDACRGPRQAHRMQDCLPRAPCRLPTKTTTSLRGHSQPDVQGHGAASRALHGTPLPAAEAARFDAVRGRTRSHDMACWAPRTPAHPSRKCATMQASRWFTGEEKTCELGVRSRRQAAPFEAHYYSQLEHGSSGEPASHQAVSVPDKGTQAAPHAAGVILRHAVHRAVQRRLVGPSFGAHSSQRAAQPATPIDTTPRVVIFLAGHGGDGGARARVCFGGGSGRTSRVTRVRRPGEVCEQGRRAASYAVAGARRGLPCAA